MENSPISWCFILGEGERKLRNETRWKDDIYCGSWRLHEFSVDNPETQIIILAVTIVATIVATIVTIVATIVATLVTIVATLRPSSERQVFASSLKVPGRLPTMYVAQISPGIKPVTVSSQSAQFPEMSGNRLVKQRQALGRE